jgi:hypothetical protein
MHVTHDDLACLRLWIQAFRAMAGYVHTTWIEMFHNLCTVQLMFCKGGYTNDAPVSEM